MTCAATPKALMQLDNFITGTIRKVREYDHGVRHRNIRWYGKIKTSSGSVDFQSRHPVEKGDLVVFANFDESDMIQPHIIYNHSQDDLQLYGSLIGITFGILTVLLGIALMGLLIYLFITISVVMVILVVVVGGIGLGLLAVRLEHAQTWYWIDRDLRALRQKLIAIAEIEQERLTERSL